MSSKLGDKPKKVGKDSHGHYWHERYWFWMSRGKRPAQASRLATRDESEENKKKVEMETGQ